MIAKVAFGLTGAVLGLGLGLFVSGCGDECNCPTPGEIGVSGLAQIRRDTPEVRQDTAGVGQVAWAGEDENDQVALVRGD